MCEAGQPSLTGSSDQALTIIVILVGLPVRWSACSPNECLCRLGMSGLYSVDRGAQLDLVARYYRAWEAGRLPPGRKKPRQSQCFLRR